MDFNHELAEVTPFQGEITAVREATEEELTTDFTVRELCITARIVPLAGLLEPVCNPQHAIGAHLLERKVLFCNDIIGYAYHRHIVGGES